MNWRPTDRGMRAALAALMLAAAPAAAQVSDPDRFRDQTPEEIAAIIALNRVQIERGQAAAARQAEIFARAQAEAEAYRRELDHNQQLWFDYEIQAREQAEAYRRALQEQSRIEAACRRGDLATCNRAWLERGLPPPPAP